jgi:hypothetical protein
MRGYQSLLLNESLDHLIFVVYDLAPLDETLSDYAALTGNLLHWGDLAARPSYMHPTEAHYCRSRHLVS